MKVSEATVPVSSGPGAPSNGLSAMGSSAIGGPMIVDGADPRDVDLVQLLTPEGERVDHPHYAFTGGDEQIKSFYRDMVLTRRIDAEATALQRQGELGI